MTDDPRAVNLGESMQAIQVSLTALHERLSSLEHVQMRALAATRGREENPWMALVRGMGILSLRPGAAGTHAATGAKRRGWVLTLLFRLLSTARRAVIDISFILVMLCLFRAGRAAIRRRIGFGALGEAGGRRAVVEFWKGVVEVAAKVGNAWDSR